MAECIRALDWAATPLGPLGQWPQSLKSAVDTVLGSPLPMAVLWGRDLIRIYNDAYSDLIGAKHPAGLGQPLPKVWPEIWEFLQPIYEAVFRGEARSLPRQKLTLLRYGTPEEAWFDLTYSPLRDETGTVAGVLLVAIEVTEHVRGAATLLQREERERLVLESVSDAVVAIDAGWYFVLLNRAAEEYFGLSRDAVIGLHTYDVLPATEGSIFEQQFAHVMATGESVTFNAPSVVRPGRTIEMRVAPMASGIVISFSDITERKRVEEALQASEAELRLITDSIPALIGYVDRERCYRFVNRAYMEWFGLSEQEILGRHMRDLLSPRVYERVEPQIEMALSGKVVHFENVLWPEDRVTVHHLDVALHIHTTYVPRIRADGEIEGMYILVTDITPQKRAQEAQQTLIAELQHRTRNLLALVQSVSRQTQLTSPSLGEFIRQFHSRLASLGRVQSLLSKGGGHSVTLHELIETELQAHGTSVRDGRVTVEGPRIYLHSKAVHVLALALHELATNALKYGALGQEQAALSVQWEISSADGRRYVSIDWTEMGVSLPRDVEAKSGFGRRLIERALPYDLGAETSFRVAADGVRCSIRVPLDPDVP